MEQMETLVGMVTNLDLVQYRTNSKSRKAHIRVKAEPRDKFFLKFPSERELIFRRPLKTLALIALRNQAATDQLVI